MTTDSNSGPSSVQRVQSASRVPGRKEDDFASILDDEEAWVENILHFIWYLIQILHFLSAFLFLWGENRVLDIYNVIGTKITYVGLAFECLNFTLFVEIEVLYFICVT